MDKNTLSGLALMGLVIFFFLWLNKPTKEQIEAQRAAQEAAQKQMQQVQSAKPLDFKVDDNSVMALAQIVKAHGTPDNELPALYRMGNPAINVTADWKDSIPVLSGTVKVGHDDVDVNRILNDDLSDYTPEQAEAAHRALAKVVTTYSKYKSFGPFYYGENEQTVIENDEMRVTFASKGGMIEEIVLKKYKNETTDPAQDITLFNAQTAGYRFAFVTSDQRIYTDSLYFRTTEVTDSSLVMSLPLGRGIEWGIRYTVNPDYLVKMEVIQQGIDAVIPPSCTTMGFDWHQKLGRNEVGRTFEERQSRLLYKFWGEKPDQLSESKDDTENLKGRIKWVAFKNQFFSSVVIPQVCFTTCDVTSIDLKNNQDFVKNMRMSGVMPYNTADGTPLSFDFYFGPNDYPLLSSIDKKIETQGDKLYLNQLVPLGWWWVRWINQILTIPLFSFLSKFISNYGIIILILTIIVKLILFPFTYKSYISQAKMRVLAPEIKEINEKYPGQENAMKRQQETMALYSRAGASPFSGCLPMMLQMPVLIALFWFFPSAIELRGQSFLWAHDLSAPDYICTLPFTIPWYGNKVSLFCLLMTVVNIIYMRLSMQNQPANNSMPGMKWMMYLMPVMFLFFFNDYASGLSYYYFLSLLITIAQTYACRKFVDEKKVRAQMLENAKKPKKKSGFMARLEAAQKQQEAMMRQQAKDRGKKRK
ncbi:MAG: membrane protein insertase YidC [Bacteroidales bacterium]|nr:membrane protein insertase YidC [Bacteroidales bacterium]